MKLFKRRFTAIKIALLIVLGYFTFVNIPSLQWGHWHVEGRHPEFFSNRFTENSDINFSPKCHFPCHQRLLSGDPNRHELMICGPEIQYPVFFSTGFTIYDISGLKWNTFATRADDSELTNPSAWEIHQ